MYEEWRDIRGYLRVYLYKNGKGKSFYIHRLVAEAFIPNPNKYQEVNHKDENSSNNRADNLEWCTHKYNSNYGTRNKRVSLTQKINGKNKDSKHPKARKVQCITTGKKFNCIKEAGRYYLLSDSSTRNITNCCRGKYKYCGKHPVTGEKLVWKYIN